jgi:hypothetical protein
MSIKPKQERTLISWTAQRDLTYKCSALTSISRPDVVPLETGMAPSSRLLNRSSTTSFERFPIECGIDPVNLLEFRSLREIAIENFRKQ